MACSPPLTINESEMAQLLKGYRLALKVFDIVFYLDKIDAYFLCSTSG
jgi:hypothetical protein